MKFRLLFIVHGYMCHVSIPRYPGQSPSGRTPHTGCSWLWRSPVSSSRRFVKFMCTYHKKGGDPCGEFCILFAHVHVYLTALEDPAMGRGGVSAATSCRPTGHPGTADSQHHTDGVRGVRDDLEAFTQSLSAEIKLIDPLKRLDFEEVAYYLSRSTCVREVEVDPRLSD